MRRFMVAINRCYIRSSVTEQSDERSVAVIRGSVERSTSITVDLSEFDLACSTDPLMG